MPVRDFKQDPVTGGFAVVNGDFALVGGETDRENLEAVMQSLRIRLRLFKGECFLDESKGVDYVGKVLVKNPNSLVVSQELSANIAATPDVVSVQSAQLVGPDAKREGSIDYTVSTSYSADAVSGQVQVTTP